MLVLAHKNLFGIKLSFFKHFFVPQESNNYRARILHNRSLSFISISFLAVQLVLSSFVLTGSKVLGYASNISPESVVELINKERAKVGAPPLVVNPLLNEAAQRKAGDIFAFGYWAHVSPSGRQPWAFFREVGYNFSFAGENLARDFSSSDDAVKAWIASPSHKENITNARYQDTGVAVVDGTLGGVETTLIVQLFGTPTQTPETSKLETKETSTPLPSGSILSRSTILKSNGKEMPLFNPFALNKIIGFLILGLLLGVLIADAVFAWRKNIIRLSSRPMAHVLFIFGIMLIILLSKSGSIL